MKVTIESIKELAAAVLSACGTSDKDIGIIIDTMLYADRKGLNTHGVGRLPLYVKNIHAGHLDPVDHCSLVKDDKAMALIESNSGFGQIAAYKAAEMGITKAREYGIACVGVRHSNNFGAAGYFGDLIARKGYVALIFANASPAMAPSGGHKKILGTNPLCFAYPTGEGKDPIVLDMATAVAARGKIRLAAKNGEKIPRDWALDTNGLPTDDPNEALKGSLLPIGGVKGYGLALFVDLLAGSLTGSACLDGLYPLSDLEHDSGNGHLFIVIDAKRFFEGDPVDMENYIGKIKDCGDEGKVFMPGEQGYARTRAHSSYVELSAKQIREIDDSAALLGLKERLMIDEEE